MNSFRIFNRRAGSVLGVATLVMANLLPGLVAAATITGRSITLSSSVKDVASATYRVQFDAAHDATGAFIVDFCTDPTIGASCTAPDGIDVSEVDTSGDDTVTPLGVSTNTVKVVLDTPVDDGDPVDVELTGIHNPSDTGAFYARIITYTDSTDAGTYVADDPDNGGDNTHLDDGSVAMSITDGFNVNGSVQETMTFCASGDGGSGSPITSGCGGSLESPNLTLGTNGILDTPLSTGTVYTQISTNAAHGAVVSLKSDATGCGGLIRDGADTHADGCGIAPITSAGAIASGDAKFGLKLGNLGGASSTTTVAVGSYNTTNYFMGYVNGDASGVTSPYGDQIYNTGGDPVSDGTADLTFGANRSNLTPAGTYKASFSLIATGTF